MISKLSIITHFDEMPGYTLYFRLYCRVGTPLESSNEIMLTGKCLRGHQSMIAEFPILREIWQSTVFFFPRCKNNIASCNHCAALGGMPDFQRRKIHLCASTDTKAMTLGYLIIFLSSSYPQLVPQMQQSQHKVVQSPQGHQKVPQILLTKIFPAYGMSRTYVSDQLHLLGI